MTIRTGTGRILIDLSTAMAWRGQKPVGIVRTEREIALRLLNDPSLRTLPFMFHDERLHALDHGFARRMLLEADRGPASAAATSPAAMAAIALRQGPWRTATAVARAAARRGLRAMPVSAREEMREGLIHLRQAFRNLAYRAAPAKALPAPLVRRPRIRDVPRMEGPELPDLSLVLHPRPDDVMFTCGLGWDDFDWSPIAAAKARTGMRLVCLCYDLIPIAFPEWIPARHDLYLSHFLSMIDVADEIPCISRATEADLLRFAAARGRPRPSTRVMTLGADLPAAPDPAGIPQKLRSRLETGRFALTVGTVEVRKNHRLLLDLWDELAADPGFDLDLVVVGARGWLAEETIRRLESSPLSGTRLHWLSNLPDGALSWLYRQSHVVLYPSLYEGWGLPVVEALLQRRPVIASNRGAVPEAGMGAATIIDPDDRTAWRDAIAAAARRPAAEAPAIAVPSWDDAARSLAAVLAAMTPGAPR